MRLHWPTVAVFAALLTSLAGCATSYGPQGLSPGASMQEVAAALGPPTGRYALAEGERVEYARGPYGKHTYMLDFDAAGRLVRWEQVLTEAHFDALRPGSSRDEVLFAIGRPSESQALSLQSQTLWSWRYDSPFCKWFQVGLDAGGRVVDVGYGPDPFCEDQLTIGTQ